MRLSTTCRRATRRYWGAINELDGNRAFGTLITSEGHDCNNLGFGIFLLLNPKNGVVEINWHVIISANNNGAQTGFQIAYDLTDGTKAYIRKQASGMWSEWRHFNTSEILSNLTTTNKSSLVGAINELNSKTLSALRQVDGNVEDWNNIASPGIYSGNGSTSKNTPIEATIWINAFVVPSNGNLKYLTAYAITDKGIFFQKYEQWKMGSMASDKIATTQ